MLACSNLSNYRQWKEILVILEMLYLLFSDSKDKNSILNVIVGQGDGSAGESLTTGFNP